MSRAAGEVPDDMMTTLSACVPLAEGFRHLHLPCHLRVPKVHENHFHTRSSILIFDNVNDSLRYTSRIIHAYTAVHHTEVFPPFPQSSPLISSTAPTKAKRGVEVKCLDPCCFQINHNFSRAADRARAGRQGKRWPTAV